MVGAAYTSILPLWSFLSLMRKEPNVCVLLATWNGSNWIDEQLDSLFNQENVRVHVIASDDCSDDDTLRRLHDRSKSDPIELLPSPNRRFGNANCNFMRLIRDSDIGEAEYVAFSDQDDVWLPGKLARAITIIEEEGTQAYSSNAYLWRGGVKRILVRKDGRLRRYDYLFESAGPGCTFVLRRESFYHLRTWVLKRWSRLQNVRVHDWAIYAFGRCSGWHWYIDKESHLLYRQHERNEIGANVGLSAALTRMRMIFYGIFVRDVLAIANVVDCKAPVVDWLRRMGPADRVRLTLRSRWLRRRPLDRLALIVYFCCGPSPRQVFRRR